MNNSEANGSLFIMREGEPLLLVEGKGALQQATCLSPHHLHIFLSQIEYHKKVHYYFKMCLWCNLWIDTEICQSFVHSNTVICITRQYINSGVTKFTKKLSSHVKIVGTTMMTYSKIHIEDPQILGAMIQILVTTATWHPGLVHPLLSFWWECKFTIWWKYKLWSVYELLFQLQLKYTWSTFITNTSINLKKIQNC
jgi:hypothetical protein